MSIMAALVAQTQSFDIVIRGGHLIDPRNNINEPMDIAVKDGKIAMIAKKSIRQEPCKWSMPKDFMLLPDLLICMSTYIRDQILIRLT